jgi:hypothetical protein
MKIRSEKIICYIDYEQKGLSLFKVNDLDSRSYLIIDKIGLSSLINDYEKFSDEQLKTKVKYILNHDDKYYIYRGVKEIIFEA